MSVEGRIYIVAQTKQYDSRLGKHWAEILAVFNLGYIDKLQDITKRYKPMTHYGY